ncbi:benzoate-CoA ligase family protein [Kitasatospora sp. NPDC005856]|uniref:benzoate-CoA ligase family protein n=1 Tax=Kitasatospora sp. NPDC005856 TaxID=3154566 RepID=UPI00340386A2
MTEADIPGTAGAHSPMRYQDLPQRINVADWFVDRNDGERTALITHDGRTTYAQLGKLVNRVGHLLRGLGIGRGDRVLMALSDGVEYVATWYGVQKIGAVTAEVYSYLHPKDYRYYLDYVKPSITVVDRATVAGLREAGERNLLVMGLAPEELREGELHFETLLATQSDELTAVDVDRDDIVMWKFTTGSTGAPKAVLVPARSPVLSFDWYARGVLGLRPDDVVLPVPKLFFGYSRDTAVLFPFGVGAAGVVFPERTTPDRIFDLIEEHRPTVLVNVPTMIKAMVNHPDARSRDLSSLRLCISAGEALPGELHRKWLDTFGVEVMDSIGSCEVYHAYISNRPGAARIGSLGTVVPGYQVDVVDQQGDPLPDGELGVLQVVGETAASGYWEAPEQTAVTFPAEHTVRTGDLFTRDEEGYFYYRGRADDLLKVHGVWVSPIEIEDCLLNHPAVEECAVVGYQEDGLTLTRAYVVARGEVSADELKDFVRARMSPQKYPRDVRFVVTLPQTANGKVDRKALQRL